MCVWVTYPCTCWICDSCLSATWTSSAPRRSQWRPRVPSLPRERSRSLSMVLTPPPSLLQVLLSLPRVPPSIPRVLPSLPRVPLSLPRVPPSLPRVPPSLSSLATPIGWWWQVWWWSFGAPGDAPSSSWYRYFYHGKEAKKRRREEDEAVYGKKEAGRRGGKREKGKLEFLEVKSEEKSKAATEITNSSPAAYIWNFTYQTTECADERWAKHLNTTDLGQ